jgi:AcrR family transcriptional regulator
MSKRPNRESMRLRYDAKRLEVVDAAARVFAQRGYHATSIDDLVEATGLQRGGLYHYIEGKQDLLVAIHERFIEPLLESSRAIVAADLPADEALREFARALMRDIVTYRDHVTVFLHEWRAIEEGPAWRRIQAARREFETMIESVLVRGSAQQVFAVSDTRLTTLAFLGMINYSYQWYDPAGPHTADEIAEHLSSIFLGGVTAESARKSPV